MYFINVTFDKQRYLTKKQGRFFSYSVLIYISAYVLDLIIKYLISVLFLIIVDLSVNDLCVAITNTSYVYVDL